MAETINTQTTGYECVGIEKIEQTYEGLYDNKPNIITIYLTNGDTHQFKVMNGSQGVGIDRIEQRQSSTVSGGRNEFAIILTNGKEYTFSTYNGSGGSGSSGSFNQVLQHLNNMLMPSGKSYLYYNGSGFEWKSPDGSTGGGTADLSEYSWWGRKFDPASKMITGEMSAVTSIEFQSTKGETTIRKKLYLDENGDLCFNGNLYATGGITALGSGGGTSGGGSSSTLYPFTIYNGSSDNDYITYDGSSAAYLKFKSGFSISKVGLGYEISATGGSGSGVTLNPTMSQMNKYLDKTTLNTPQFLYWTGTTYTWKDESEISGGSGGSIQVAEAPNSGESTNWITATKLRFNAIVGTKPTIRSIPSEDCVDIGIPVGSGSGSRIKRIKLFNSHSDNSFETIELGTADTIGFMAGDNVTLQSVVKEYTNVIKISASGGSGSGSSGSVSWTDVTNKPSTFTPSSHSHSTNEINGLSSYVHGTKVSNATNADRLANAVTLWGNSFSGNNSIGTASSRADLKYVKDIYAGDTFDIKAGNNSLLKVDGTPNIYVGFGYMANNKASLYLFGNKTTIYTSGDDYRYDFNGGVFDVNTNTIHFGPEAGGGKISWDRANNAFKIEGNLYTTGGITALGVSNSTTTTNNVDFTFKSVTANTFNVKNSIQISNKLELVKYIDDVYLSNTDSSNEHYIYLDGNDRNYYLNSSGSAYINDLTCDSLNISSVENFEIVDITSTGFNIQFTYGGKTYKFYPSDAEITVS